MPSCATPPEPLRESLLEDVSRLFRALGEAPRLRILRVLLEAGEALDQKVVAGAAGLSQPNASKHLLHLVSAGLVSREARGNRVLFRPVQPLVPELCGMVCAHVADRIKHIYESMN
jgi:DNA-binding transcriptional ArsR family regulator